jgi:hypothetical protein
MSSKAVLGGVTASRLRDSCLPYCLFDRPLQYLFHQHDGDGSSRSVDPPTACVTGRRTARPSHGWYLELSALVQTANRPPQIPVPPPLLTSSGSPQWRSASRLLVAREPAWSPLEVPYTLSQRDVYDGKCPALGVAGTHECIGKSGKLGLWYDTRALYRWQSTEDVGYSKDFSRVPKTSVLQKP